MSNRLLPSDNQFADVGPALLSSTWGHTSKIVVVVIWGLGIAAGSLYSLDYATTPTKTHSVVDHWLVESACTLCAHQPTLVMFVHPRCPCSRASLNELAILMTHCQGRVNVQVLFMKPPSLPADWAKTDLWDSAADIPGVMPRLDLDGAEQRRFAARVSGEVFLYLPDGSLAFHGGITAGRGHYGDNQGRAAIEALLLDRDLQTGSTPVFGCELEPPGSSSNDLTPGDTRGENDERH